MPQDNIPDPLSSNRSGGSGVAVTGRPPAWALVGWRFAAKRVTKYCNFREAFEIEWEERRCFLWFCIACVFGAVLYFAAEREPVLWMPLGITASAALLAFFLRHHRSGYIASMAVLALALGFTSAKIRTSLVATPMLRSIRIVEVTGLVEEVNSRDEGDRLTVRLASADTLPLEQMPVRVRVSMRGSTYVNAGDFIAFKARLLPAAGASLPGGYEFSRDAYFSRIGAVGSILGKVEIFDPPDPPSWFIQFSATLDRFRNRLGKRIEDVIGGDAGAIAVAMVTGKRDRLNDSTKELIRQAGIFHIITISGLQMSLVAGILYWLLRRLLSLSRNLTLAYPIKKWAAVGAIIGAILYDMATGSRVGTERALLMTMIVFLAILCERETVSMRNLGLAALVVVVLEPEAIMGASFQLSFAAVAALIALYEQKYRGKIQQPEGIEHLLRRVETPASPGWLFVGIDRFRSLMSHGIGAVLTATLCASLATAPFMAANFHEISPYVAIGNPLTMLMIEFIAVPGALLGSLLYPLGLDGLVWQGVGAGINLVLRVAAVIANMPGATLHVGSFAPWTILCFALGIACFLLWRTLPWRLLGVFPITLGLIGAFCGTRADILLAPSGDMIGFRDSEQNLRFLSKKLNSFVVEQWLRADGDDRNAAHISNDREMSRCDDNACVVHLAQGQILSLIDKPLAFDEDCNRADIIVTYLRAPSYCKPKLLFDKAAFATMGAIGLSIKGRDWIIDRQISLDDDRPWRVSSDKTQFAKKRNFGSKEGWEENGETPSFAAPDTPAIN